MVALLRHGKWEGGEGGGGGASRGLQKAFELRDARAAGVFAARLKDLQLHAGEARMQVAVEGQRPPLPDGLPGCPAALQRLITSCWADSPHARPSSKDVLELTTQLLLEADTPSAAEQQQQLAPRRPEQPECEGSWQLQVTQPQAP